MREIKIEAEPLHPDPSTLKFIQDCSRDIHANGDFDEWADAYLKGHSRRISFDLNIIEKLVNHEDKIIEFGSAPYLLTYALKHRGFSVHGLDIDPNRFSDFLMSSDLTVTKCNFETEKVPLPNGCADVVIFNELFEHMRINLIHTMREVRRILRPNGLLLMSTPNLRSLVGFYNFLIKNRAYALSVNIFDEYQKLETIGHMGHVREYTTKEVTDFLGCVDLNVECMIFRGAFGGRLKWWTIRFIPRLRPFVTYVARAV